MKAHLSSKFLIFGGAAAALWLLLRYFTPILLPFLLAAFLALSAEKGVSWMHERLRLPRAVAAFVGVGSVFLLVLTLLILLLASLMRQIPRLTWFLPQLEQAILSGRDLLENWLLSLAGKLPGSVGDLLTEVTEGFFDRGDRMIEPILQRVPQLATNLVGKMSTGLFGTVTGLIASFMLSVRLPKLRGWLKAKLPLRLQDRCIAAGKGLRWAMGGWLLAQIKLAAVTFGVLLAGFFLLRIPHVLLWAFLVTLVDAFPVLGVGTVLLPWSLVSILQGNLPLGLGLLAVYAVAWVLRSVLEPKLVGESLGLDPLVTLLAIYAGFQLWGITGMLLAPVLAMTGAQLWKALQSPQSPI